MTSFAQAIAPQARVVYVDHDPIVLAHARALLTSSEAGATEYIDADLRDSDKILGQARQLLDFSRPVALTLLFILHAIPDSDDPHAIVARIMDALPSGSCLAISHLTSDFSPDEVTLAAAAATSAGVTLVPRGRDAVARFFGDWELLAPGLVPLVEWRPAVTGRIRQDEVYHSFFGGVARKK